MTYMLPPSKRKKISEAEKIDVDIANTVKKVNGDDSGTVDDHKDEKSRFVLLS